MQKHCFFCCLSCILIFWVGCTSDYGGDFPESTPKPVVNALLAADSTFTLRLSLPGAQTGVASFTVIDDAVVLLWEDSVLLGIAASVGNGQYHLDSVLKAGCRYLVEINVPNAQTITAITTIPHAPVIDLMYEKVDGEYGGIDNYSLQLGRPEVNASGIWLFVTERNDDESMNEQSMMLYCNSSLCDNFNRSLNSTAQGGYSFSYDYFIRIQSSMLSFDVNRIELASWISMRKSRFAVITASVDYDQFFRTAFIQKYWSPSSDLPFTYQPITVYSNVNGGYGIFAGYNVAAYYFN